MIIKTEKEIREKIKELDAQIIALEKEKKEPWNKDNQECFNRKLQILGARANQLDWLLYQMFQHKKLK